MTWEGFFVPRAATVFCLFARHPPPTPLFSHHNASASRGNLTEASSMGRWRPLPLPVPITPARFRFCSGHRGEGGGGIYSGSVAIVDGPRTRKQGMHDAPHHNTVELSLIDLLRRFESLRWVDEKMPVILEGSNEGGVWPWLWSILSAVAIAADRVRPCKRSGWEGSSASPSSSSPEN